jgi:amino acid permease
MVSALKIQSLQWIMGLFCTVLGAVMLVMPHQFHAGVCLGLHPHLRWWGVRV